MPVLPLNKALDVNLVGGKAAQLGSLLRLGINVPDGFVITTDATKHLSDDVIATACDHFDRLGTRHVAVRSSAIAEDGDVASWAGQFDSYLFVDREQLIDKIKSCIASTESPHSIAYGNHARQTTRPDIAVVVQAMIPSDVSGVCFSVHPVTQNANHITIEAAYGLGEAVVSGEVTPDNYVVSRQPRNILSRAVANQSKVFVFSEKKGSTIWTSAENPAAPKLSDEQILELAAAAERLESHFDHPVDMEWAYHAGKLYILQSRPITTL